MSNNLFQLGKEEATALARQIEQELGNGYTATLEANSPKYVEHPEGGITKHQSYYITIWVGKGDIWKDSILTNINSTHDWTLFQCAARQFVINETAREMEKRINEMAQEEEVKDMKNAYMDYPDLRMDGSH